MLYSLLSFISPKLHCHNHNKATFHPVLLFMTWIMAHLPSFSPNDTMDQPKGGPHMCKASRSAPPAQPCCLNWNKLCFWLLCDPLPDPSWYFDNFKITSAIISQPPSPINFNKNTNLSSTKLMFSSIKIPSLCNLNCQYFSECHCSLAVWKRGCSTDYEELFWQLL